MHFLHYFLCIYLAYDALFRRACRWGASRLHWTRTTYRSDFECLLRQHSSESTRINDFTKHTWFATTNWRVSNELAAVSCWCYERDWSGRCWRLQIRSFRVASDVDWLLWEVHSRKINQPASSCETSTSAGSRDSKHNNDVITTLQWQYKHIL